MIVVGNKRVVEVVIVKVISFTVIVVGTWDCGYGSGGGCGDGSNRDRLNLRFPSTIAVPPNISEN